MAKTNDMHGSIYQNLIDAGCDESVTENCMLLVKDGRVFDILPILAKHRRSLLDSVHTSQKQIDCLDYLIYSLKKQK